MKSFKLGLIALLASIFASTSMISVAGENSPNSNMEWDNNKYLEVRSDLVDHQKKDLMASGHFVNVLGDTPTVHNYGAVEVIVFAGVTMSQFKSFAKINNPAGDCVEAKEIEDYSSVVCVFKI